MVNVIVYGKELQIFWMNKYIIIDIFKKEWYWEICSSASET